MVDVHTSFPGPTITRGYVLDRNVLVRSPDMHKNFLSTIHDVTKPGSSQCPLTVEEIVTLRCNRGGIPHSRENRELQPHLPTVKLTEC